jgi:hypothetical protein
MRTPVELSLVRRNADMVHEIERLRLCNHDLRKMLRKLLKEELGLSNRNTNDKSTQTEPTFSSNSPTTVITIRPDEVYAVKVPYSESKVVHTTPPQKWNEFKLRSQEFWSQTPEELEKAFTGSPDTECDCNQEDITTPKQNLAEKLRIQARLTRTPLSKTSTKRRAVTRDKCLSEISPDTEYYWGHEPCVASPTSPVAMLPSATIVGSTHRGQFYDLILEQAAPVEVSTTNLEVDSVVSSNVRSQSTSFTTIYGPSATRAIEDNVIHDKENLDNFEELPSTRTPPSATARHRPRRSVLQPISYTETPLNVKVRKGFQFFKRQLHN